MKPTMPTRMTVAGVMLAALLAPFALAQSSTTAPEEGTGPIKKEEETVKLERFVVTGSLIPIAADTPAVPVTVMSAADIADSGLSADLTDVLKKVNPFFYGRGSIGQENANTRANSTNGASTVSLRNRSTLVLINGRRASISPTAATGSGHFVDVSLIPVAAVERIEVLADGASATYGTDAVSGVVNIILKKDYRGVETGGYFGWAPNASNWSTRRAYVSLGAGNEKTTVTASLEWRQSDPLFQYERHWGLNQFRTASFAGVITPDAINFYYLNPSLNAPPLNLDLSVAQLVAQGIYQGPLTQDQVAPFFDLSEKATMFMKSERRSFALATEHKFNDRLTGFADILATQSMTENTLNAQPVSGNVTASSPINPANVTIQARNRFRAFPRMRNGDTLGMRGVFGLRGNIGATWSYEIAASLNRTTQHLLQKNLIDLTAYNAAVANLTYNPFARQQAPGVLEGLVGNGVQDYTSRLNSFDVRFTGELFDLPAGPVQMGLGAESRQERIAMINDRNEQLGLWLGATPTNPFAAKQSVDAFFAEARIPVFGGEKRIKGFHTLEFGLAARKELYSSTTDPLVPKYSMRWLPFNDELALRATYSEAFTAPTIFALYGPSNSGFTSSITLNRYDTSGNSLGVATGQRQYRSRGGSNPNLVPAESRNWTAGLVWSPRRIKGLSVTLDWFDIDERNLVSNVPIISLLQSVEQFGTASPYAGQVRLAPSVAGELHFDDGAPVTTPGQITSGASDAVWVTNPLLNVAGAWQSGLDVRVEYTFTTANWGRFNASVASTYLHNYSSQSLPNTAAGNFQDGFTGAAGNTYPRFRTFSQLDWQFKEWSAGVNHTFIPELDDLGAPVEAPITSYQTFDARLTYNFNRWNNPWLKGLRLTVGVNNLLNEDPPFAVSEQDQNRDINTYDALGRFFYVSAAYKF